MPSDITLMLAHGPGNPRNSEGAFVDLADGRILFAYTRFCGDSGGDGGAAVIAGRFSADGGRTWSPADRTLVENEGRRNVMSVSLLRLHDGRIALFYLRKNSPHDCIPYLRTSHDEGATWSDPVRCIPAPGYFVVNNDRVIQLRNGRLVMPASFHRNRQVEDAGRWGTVTDSRGIAMFFLSDDAGATWREAADWWALPRRSGAGLQEPGAVELTGGQLYAWARTDTGRQWELRSADRGEHWSSPQPSRFHSPCSPLSMKRIPATGDLVAVWNDHSGRWPRPLPKRVHNWAEHPSRGRAPLAIGVSRDGGRTWRHNRLVEDDLQRGYCYTAIHCTADAVLLAYCCGGDGRILADSCIRRLTYDWLYGRER